MEKPTYTLWPDFPDKHKICTTLALIVLISFIAYLPVFHNSLLNWDDAGYIKYNPLVLSFNLKGIFSQFAMGNYHPISLLILAIEYQFFGLNPAGYHTINLLLHLLNVILVFYTVYLLSDKYGVALVASLLFGIHPLHVESVAWVAELKDLLYTFFFLTSYFFYLKFLKDPQKKYYIFALLLFLVSLLSKAMAVSLPLVLILTDYFKGRKIDKKSLSEKVPFFLLAIVTGVVAILAQGSNPQDAALPQRFIFASYGFVSYLIKLLVPFKLSAFYPYPLNNEIPFYYYLYLLSLVGLAVCIYYSGRFTRKIIFGMGFFIATLIFVLQLLPVGDAIMADRYSYIPSIGIFYLAGEGFLFLWNMKLKWPALIVLSAAVLLFSGITYTRCGVWKDDLTLWNDVISKYNTAPVAFYNRGIVFKDEKRHDQAISDFNRAIELKPDYAVAFYERGVVFINKNRLDDAVMDFDKAIELKPDCFPAYLNRGIIYGNEKRYDVAISDLDKAIRLKPDYALAYYNRGIFEFYSGKKAAACEDLKKAAQLGNMQAAGAYAQLCQSR
jgi:tetratricopeptide (TPR) repeat protein